MEETSAMAISLIDHTSLGDEDNIESIERFVLELEHASMPAAICIYTRCIDGYRRAVSKLNVRYPKLATVINFPFGLGETSDVLREVDAALDLGVDELDVVVDYQRVAAEGGGAASSVSSLIREVKSRLLERGRPEVLVKAILETGFLDDPELIKIAGVAAVEGGADFLKTSTGKYKVNATVQAVEVLLKVAKDVSESGSNRIVGVKIAGGVKSLQDVITYFDLCDRLMGKEWRKSPRNLRFGSSSLLNQLTKL